MANSFLRSFVCGCFSLLVVSAIALVHAAEPKPATTATEKPAAVEPASNQPAEKLDPAALLKQDFKSKLPRIAPTEPADALKAFTVAPGFRIEQVAAEPLVNSPVAM